MDGRVRLDGSQKRNSFVVIQFHPEMAVGLFKRRTTIHLRLFGATIRPVQVEDNGMDFTRCANEIT